MTPSRPFRRIVLAPPAPPNPSGRELGMPTSARLSYMREACRYGGELTRKYLLKPPPSFVKSLRQLYGLTRQSSFDGETQEVISDVLELTGRMYYGIPDRNVSRIFGRNGWGHAESLFEKGSVSARFAAEWDRVRTSAMRALSRVTDLKAPPSPKKTVRFDQAPPILTKRPYKLCMDDRDVAERVMFQVLSNPARKTGRVAISTMYRISPPVLQKVLFEDFGENMDVTMTLISNTSLVFFWEIGWERSRSRSSSPSPPSSSGS